MLRNRLAALLVLAGLLGGPAASAGPCEPPAGETCCCAPAEESGTHVEPACDCGCAVPEPPAAPKPAEPKRAERSGPEPASFERATAPLFSPRCFPAGAPARTSPACASPPLFLLHRSLLL